MEQRQFQRKSLKLSLEGASGLGGRCVQSLAGHGTWIPQGEEARYSMPEGSIGTEDIGQTRG